MNNKKYQPFIVTSNKTNTRWFYYSITIALVFLAVSIFIKSEAWMLVMIFSFFALVVFIQSRDKKPIIIVDYDGIWTPKTQLIYWPDIATMYTVNDYDSENIHQIVLSINKIETRIEFSISDQSIYQIRNAIQFFSAGHDIVDNGHKTIPENYFDY